ncbi:MAG: DUF6036 family nucleotidyltransferase [Sphingobacteriaceae bacterium]
MDVFDEELLRFWRFCNQTQLKYIMIGGVATNLHGFNRSTEDIDIWIEDTGANRLKLQQVFEQYGWADVSSFKTIQFVPGWTYFHLDNGIRLDIMTTVKGLEEYSFDECLNAASIATIYDVDIPFLHLNQLIQAKQASNRPKDQIDVLALSKIKDLIEKREAEDE